MLEKVIFVLTSPKGLYAVLVLVLDILLSKLDIPKKDPFNDIFVLLHNVAVSSQFIVNTLDSPYASWSLYETTIPVNAKYQKGENLPFIKIKTGSR
jgi:hypothetical protein